MRLLIVCLSATVSLAGCVTQPTSPKEVYLNRHAAAQVIAAQCPSYGGYSSVVAMRQDAEKNLSEAVALGATETDLAKAHQNAKGAYTTAAILVGDMQACNSMMNSLAMAGTSKPRLTAN